MQPLRLRPWTELLTIQKKDLKVERIDLSEPFAWAQDALRIEIERQYNLGLPVRIICLKGRQLGVSTMSEGTLFNWTFLHPGTRSLVIAHETKAAQHLFDMTKLMWEEWPFNPLYTEKHNTIKSLSWVETRSSMSVATAKNAGSGRSFTYHAVHCCLHQDSLVVLADGSSKPIKAVELGDRVFTSSGAIAPISAKTATGERETYRVRMWLGNEDLVATPEHKVLTIEGYKTVGHLTSQDWIAKPKYRFTSALKWECSVPFAGRPQHGGTSRVSHRVFDLDAEFGYLVGYYLAEGHISKKRNRVSFGYKQGETFVDNVAKFFANPPRKIRRAGTRTEVAEFNDVFMAHALDELCGRVENKHVPPFGNLDFFAGIMEGYLDGDGSKTQKIRTTATSVHERIARNINRIGDMLGRHGGLAFYDNRRRYGIATKPIWVNNFCDGLTRPWIKKYRFVDGQCFVRVKSVVPDERAPTWDIEVDHPDHNFETPSGIVSNSECAFWDEPERLMVGLNQSVPYKHGTIVILESTANGVGNWFHEEWTRAVRGESQYVPLFFPWFKHEEYSFPTTTLKSYELLKEERELAREFGLSLGQLAWRRHTIVNDCLGDDELFKQEFPCTPNESFLSTGRNVFPLQRLDEHTSVDSGVKGMLVNDKGTIKFIRDATGPLTIFKSPGRDPLKARYVVAGDPTKTTYGDKACIQVINRFTFEQVAVFHQHLDAVPFAHQLMMLAYYYNTALLNCEIEGPGYATIGVILDNSYPDLWQHRWADKAPGKVSTSWGWSTNYQRKHWAMEKVKFLLAQRGVFTIHDRITHDQMENYVYLQNGEMGPASDGLSDDAVMAMAIAVVSTMTEATLPHEEQAEAEIHDLFNKPPWEAVS
jgi:hypothetical protein